MQKRILKPLTLFTFLSSMAFNAHAVEPGFYLGLMAGPAINDAKNKSVLFGNGSATTTTATPSSTKNFGGRLFLGYKFIRFAAVESGFSFFSPIRYRANLTTGSNKPVAWFGTIDFSGKGSLPFYGFEVYGKLGLALNNLTKSSAFDIDSPDNPKKSNIWTFGPIYGVGANYTLTQNWVADLAVNRVNIGDVVGTITFYTLGVSYHFVDVYCGQFLC